MFVLDVVHGGDRLLSILILSESHKSKATAATSVAILDNDLYMSNVRNKLIAQQGQDSSER